MILKYIFLFQVKKFKIRLTILKNYNIIISITLCTAYKATVQTEQAMDCITIRGAGPCNKWQQMKYYICGTVVYYYCSTGVFLLLKIGTEFIHCLACAIELSYSNNYDGGNCYGTNKSNYGYFK